MSLAIRIIPVITHRGHNAIKGTQFNSWRSIGDVRTQVEVFQSREVDELVLLDISATYEGRSPDLELVRSLAETCFMPLAVGGGVHSTQDVGNLLANGADKVVINSAAIGDPNIIGDSAHKYGSQAIVVSIDAKLCGFNDYSVYSDSGTKDTSLHPVAWAKICEDRGAGEILLTSIDMEGSLLGYDIDLIRMVSDAVRIPVVANGGAGRYRHFKEALDVGAHGVAAGAMWAFLDYTPAEAAEYLHSNDYRVRRSCNG
jgi:imidazole glycerol-phosphate synthase subunit HisF